MSVNVLLDENLSPWVAVELCRSDGIDACHVRDRGMLGMPDTTVLDKAFAEDRIVVTCNIDDFVDLAGGNAIAAIHRRGDLFNRVLRVAFDGSMSVEDIPPA